MLHDMKVIYQRTDKRGRVLRDRSERKSMNSDMAAAMSKLANVACIVAYETEKSTTCYVNGRMLQTAEPLFVM